MKILITGNMGYIGPIVAKHFRERFPECFIVGLDTCFFGHCLTVKNFLPEHYIDEQFFMDVRAIEPSFLSSFDAIVHLAAVSNDPIGNKFESVTDEINHLATIRLAEIASEQGVKSFVFASSCSMYGNADDGEKKESDVLNPISAYARSKVAAEKGLGLINNSSMAITSLRFSTACGFSPRTRLDLVLNDFVACAISQNKITVLSDGSPWRPLIDVKDMARAIEWAVFRVKDNDSRYLAVNVGAELWNFQVKDLAASVARIIPNTLISINADALPDKRSYKVDFSLFKKLAPNHQPISTLDFSIKELYQGLDLIKFEDKNFRNSHFMRLKVLEDLMRKEYIDINLRWRI